jgi:eukaryotic-like serine/threonine-protein kinase
LSDAKDFLGIPLDTTHHTSDGRPIQVNYDGRVIRELLSVRLSSMNEPTSEFDADEVLIAAFLECYRRGERPPLSEFAANHPELAERVRSLVSAMLVLEGLGMESEADRQPGPLASLADVPTRLGDYRILGRIGEGGMGAVYEAERESLRSRVALKVMHPRFRTSPDYLRRFHNEARSAAQLHHTNIVSVFDFGEHDGVCYYAMQYIAGHSLDEILADIRRHRLHQGQGPVAPVQAEPEATTKEQASPSHAFHDAGRNGAAPDPLMRTITRGLFTGQFGKVGGGGLDVERTPVPAPAPVEPATDARADASNNLGFGFGWTKDVAPLSARDADRGHRDSASGSLTSSLVGQGEHGYYKEVARLGAQVADALVYAHERGVLHRDIKPSNLLLDAVGNVWVTDFGLAKFEEGEDLSQSHDVVGTLRYMAPERFRGVSDRRCDIYSLGATLYELSTLRPVFESADRLRLIDQIVRETPAPPRQLDQGIPRDLETIILKALAKDPKDRFAMADELAAELRRFRENRPIQSRPIPAYERVWRWCKRNRAQAALMTLAAGLTVMIAVGATVAAWTYRGQRDDLRHEQERTTTSLNRAEYAEHEARLALGKSLLAEGAALERTGLSGQRFDSLHALGEAARVLGADARGRDHLPEIRDLAIAALGLTDLRVRVRQDCISVSEMCIDFVHERYAGSDHSGEIVIRRLHDNGQLFRLRGPDRADFQQFSPTFSPDGEMLVAGYTSSSQQTLLRIWQLEPQELLGSVMGRQPLIFHPDDDRLLIGDPSGGLSVWSRRKRRIIRRLPLDFTPNSLSLDRAGSLLAVNNADLAAPRVVILDVESGRVHSELSKQVGLGALALSADGRLLAVGGSDQDPRVTVWDVARKSISSVLQGHAAETIGIQFAHTGFLLATSSFDHTTRLWDAVSGEPLAVTRGANLSVFSRDDQRMAFKDGGKVGIWDVATGAECRTLHPAIIGNRSDGLDATRVGCADISPDNEWLATGGADGAHLWETDTGRELGRLKAGYCDSVLFHPDGKSLISSGEWGLYRWPIRCDTKGESETARIGPPELLRETAGVEWRNTILLPDRRTLAMIDNPSARVLLIDSSHPHPAWSRAPALDSGENRRMTSLTASPDGRWLAAGGWRESGVRVWDLVHRRLTRYLRPADAIGDVFFYVAFSADGHWLVSCTGSHLIGLSYSFWRVGTWELDHQIHQERNGTARGAPAFTGDGRLMSLGIAPDQVMLADAASGRQLARLTTLQPLTPVPLVFSHDGTKLVASTRQKTFLVWDLRRIREQLIPMGLSWDAPADPIISASSGANGPGVRARRVTVVGEVIEPRARRAAELAEMDRRLAANPDDADALIHRGRLYTAQQKWPEALVDLERGLAQRPDLGDSLVLLAQAYVNVKNLTAALTIVEQCLARASDDTDARALKGQVLQRLGRLQEALDEFTRVLDVEPSRAQVQYLRAHVSLGMRRYPEVLADLNKLIARFPQNTDYYELRSRAHGWLGHRKQAHADIKLALDSPRAGAWLYNEVAWSLATGPIALRDPEQALVLAKKAIALAPKSANYLNTLGVAQYRTGHFAAAVNTLEKSLAAHEGYGDGLDLFFLAMGRYKLGQIANARADFDRAVRSIRERPLFREPDESEELELIRAEAEELVVGPRADLPTDVFAPK